MLPKAARAERKTDKQCRNICARVGSPVVLWGEGLPVDDVANAASTVGYELLCAVAPRVPHVTSEVGGVDIEL